MVSALRENDTEAELGPRADAIARSRRYCVTSEVKCSDIEYINLIKFSELRLLHVKIRFAYIIIVVGAENKKKEIHEFHRRT